MRSNILLVLSFFISASLFAQLQKEDKISCFADIQFTKSSIVLIVPEASQNPRMRPQVFYDNLFIRSNPFGRYCNKANELEADIKRIKTAITSAEIAKLNNKEQQIYLRQIALALIWNNLFNFDAVWFQTQIQELEQVASSKNKENLQLVINLCHQVFDGE